MCQTRHLRWPIQLSCALLFFVAALVRWLTLADRAVPFELQYPISSIAFSPTDLEVRTVDYGGHVARWSDSGTLLERNETKDDVWKDTALTNVLSYEELSAKWSRTKLVISNSQGRTVAHFDATDIRSVDFAKESRRVVFQVASDIRVYELDTGRVATVLSDIS